MRTTLPNNVLALQERIVACRRCPRLVRWRSQVAERRPEETYWSRPVPGLGDPHARLAILGLAPAAHGANRTGRMFTGDRSGEWLFRALYKAGFCNVPASRGREDRLRLHRTWITAAVRCAPPDNRPSPQERRNCAPFLVRELELLLAARMSVLVALGGFAWTQGLRALEELSVALPRPRPPFRHGAEVHLSARRRTLTLLGCYHPSQQNTFTGRLTEPMFDIVWQRARACLGSKGRKRG